MRAIKHIYGADFETDHDGATAWIVQWAISDGKREYFGPDLETWLKTVSDLLKRHRNIILYYHNLRYDLSFIRTALGSMQQEYGFEAKILMRHGAPIQLTFSKNKHSLILRDSMKKLPGDLRSMGRLIGIEKQESPYPFYPGWGERLSGGEDEYCYVRIDARIVAVAMQRLHDMGFRKATLSGDAWACAKRMLGSDANGELYPRNFTWENSFPKLKPELDRELRRAYFGGINYSDRFGQNRAIKGHHPITHEDIHSSYPSTMSADPLPHGIPTVTDTWPDDYQLYIAQIRVKMKLRDGLKPWYQFKTGVDCILENWEYGTLVEQTREWHEMSLTSVDLATLSQWYEITVDPNYHNRFFIFKSKAGILKPYIDQWYEKKETSSKGSLEYVHAKLLMNSLYGRFGLAPETEEVTLEWDAEAEDWAWISKATMNEDNDSYVPYSIFCTAYARARLLENVRACLLQEPESVIHCDTDSVIHYGPPCCNISHDDALGSWAVESTPAIIFEGGFKRYIELRRYPMQSLDDLIGMAAAGVPQKRDHNGVPIGMWVELLDEPKIITATGTILGNEHYRIKSKWLRELYEKFGMDPDDVNTCKLIPETVPGGTILRNRQHQLNDNMTWRFRR